MTIAIDSTRPETWPLVLVFAEVCTILRIGERVGYRLRQEHRFPVPELLPRLAGGPRYSRDDVLHALKSRSGMATAAERRTAMKVAR